MDVPSTNELEEAVIEILKRHPNGLSVHEILDEVMVHFELPPGARFARGNNGRSELSYRLGWARTHAKIRGKIERLGTGRWKII